MASGFPNVTIKGKTSGGVPVSVLADVNGRILASTPGKLISLNPTIGAGAYSVGDVIGPTGATAGMTITTPFQVAGGSAIWQSLMVCDWSNQMAAMDFLIYMQLQENHPDNDAFAPGNDGEPVAICRVTAADYVSIGSVAWACVKGPGTVLANDLGLNDLKLIVVSQGTPTYAGATDLVFRIGLIDD